MLLNNVKPMDNSEPVTFNGEGDLVLSHKKNPYTITNAEHIDMHSHFGVSTYGKSTWGKLKMVWRVAKYIFNK